MQLLYCHITKLTFFLQIKSLSLRTVSQQTKYHMVMNLLWCCHPPIIRAWVPRIWEHSSVSNYYHYHHDYHYHYCYYKWIVFWWPWYENSNFTHQVNFMGVGHGCTEMGSMTPPALCFSISPTIHFNLLRWIFCDWSNLLNWDPQKGLWSWFHDLKMWQHEEEDCLTTNRPQTRTFNGRLMDQTLVVIFAGHHLVREQLGMW